MVKKKKKAKKKGLFRRLVKKKAKPKAGGGRKKKVKSVKKVSKKTSKIKKGRKEDNFVVGFEEVKVTCASCGREFMVVKSSGFSMDGMLCQRCSAGGGVGFEGSDDF